MQAAALPYRVANDCLEVLLVTTLDTKRWIIPKGWRMKGRTPAVSAAREAFEEAGVKGAVEPEPFGTFRYEKVDRRGATRQLEVTVFLLRVDRQKRKWPEQNRRQTKWFSLEDAISAVEESSLKTLFRIFGEAN